MFLDMDYCQLPAFLNNTVMNILTHKVFFISLFYECLVGKENWGTCVSYSYRTSYTTEKFWA